MATAKIVGTTSKKYYNDRSARREWVKAGSPADQEPEHQELLLVVVEITHDDGTVDTRTVYEDQLHPYLASVGAEFEEA